MAKFWLFWTDWIENPNGPKKAKFFAFQKKQKSHSDMTKIRETINISRLYIDCATISIHLYRRLL